MRVLLEDHLHLIEQLVAADLVEQQGTIQRDSLKAQRLVILEMLDRIERMAKEIGSGRSTRVETSNEIAAGRRPHRERD